MKKTTSLVFGIVLSLAIASVAQDVPKEELYLGYSYLRTGTGSQVNAFNNNGGLGALQYNFNKNIAIVGELGGFTSGNITIRNLGLLSSLDQTFFSYQFGPRFMIHKTSRITPFFQYLVGGVHESRSIAVPNSLIPIPVPAIKGVTVSPGIPSTRFRTSQNAFAMTIGGGMDVNINHRIAIRPIQLDYLPSHFSPFNIPGIGNLAINGSGVLNNTRWQNSLRYSTGVAFRFGGAPPLIPSASCTGQPNELLPDDPPFKAAVQTTNFNPKHRLDYNWASNGGQVSGNGNAVQVDVAGMKPGNYTVRANVTDPKQKQNNSASCETAFVVKQPQPPMVSCTASPTSVEAGKAVALTAQASSPDLRRIASRKFSTSAGSIAEGQTQAGNQVGEFTTSAILNTANAPPGPLNVTMAVTDVRGLTGDCVATVNVEAPPPVTVTSETLVGECDFKNPRKPGRVDNECKATLDDVSMRLQREPNGKLVVVGYSDASENVNIEQMGAQRAVNAKYYLTSGEGHQQIDPSRVEVRRATETNGGEKAELYFLSEGATFTKSDTVLVDESQFKVTGGSPAPTTKKKHHHPAATTMPSTNN
jgi:opacity protein-like surface antigen